MIQDYIAYVIIAVAFAIFIHRILSFFNLIEKKASKSGSCSGCTTGCEMKQSHLMIKGKTKKRNQYQFYL